MGRSAVNCQVNVMEFHIVWSVVTLSLVFLLLWYIADLGVHVKRVHRCISV